MTSASIFFWPILKKIHWPKYFEMETTTIEGKKKKSDTCVQTEITAKWWYWQFYTFLRLIWYNIIQLAFYHFAIKEQEGELYKQFLVIAMAAEYINRLCVCFSMSMVNENEKKEITKTVKIELNRIHSREKISIRLRLNGAVVVGEVTSIIGKISISWFRFRLKK